MLKHLTSAVLLSFSLVVASGAQVITPGPGLYGDSHWRSPSSSLPSTGNRQGDVRLSSGSLWYWNGMAWVSLSGSSGGGDGGAPSGAAGGELGGDYPDPYLLLASGNPATSPPTCAVGRAWVDVTAASERVCFCTSSNTWHCQPLTGQMFEPSQVADLTLWLRGDSLATLGYDNRQLVGHWPDSSGRGNGANQVSMSQAPLFVPAALDESNRPSVLFDGNLTQMQLPPVQSLVTSAGEGTIFSVYKLSAVQTSFGPGAIFQDEALIAEPGGNWGLHLANLSSPMVFAYSFNGTDGVVAVGVTLTLDRWQLAVMRHGGGQLCISVDGGSESCVASGATDLSGNRNADLGQGGGNKRMTGALGATLIYSRVLTSDERAKVSTYLKRRFLIP